jgi:hypothetical protein
MSFMSDAMTWPRGTLQTAAPHTATYTDASSGLTVSLTVWLGRTAFSSNAPNGARLEWGELDVMIRADELLISGSMISPARGDRIALTLNGVAVTLELFTPSTGEPPWRWSDPQRELLRIHCKRVS